MSKPTNAELLVEIRGELQRLSERMDAHQTLLKQQIDSNQMLVDGKVEDVERRVATLEHRQWNLARQLGVSATGGATAAGVVVAFVEMLKVAL